MATLLAHIKIFEGKEKEFERVARELFKATHALEPGCRRYEYFRGEKPGHYYTLLSFDDFLTFIHHQVSPHHEAPDFGKLLETIRIEFLDPVQGANDLVPTEEQSLPANATDLMRQYAESHPLKVQGWWRKAR